MPAWVLLQQFSSLHFKMVFTRSRKQVCESSCLRSIYSPSVLPKIVNASKGTKSPPLPGPNPNSGNASVHIQNSSKDSAFQAAPFYYTSKYLRRFAKYIHVCLCVCVCSCACVCVHVCVFVPARVCNMLESGIDVGMECTVLFLHYSAIFVIFK